MSNGCAYRFFFFFSHVHSRIHPFAHSLAHSFIHPFAHSLAYSRIRPFAHSLAYSRIHPFAHSLAYSRIHPFARALTQPFLCSLIDALTRSVNRSFVVVVVVVVVVGKQLIGVCVCADPSLPSVTGTKIASCVKDSMFTFRELYEKYSPGVIICG